MGGNQMKEETPQTISTSNIVFITGFLQPSFYKCLHYVSHSIIFHPLKYNNTVNASVSNLKEIKSTESKVRVKITNFHQMSRSIL